MCTGEGNDESIHVSGPDMAQKYPKRIQPSQKFISNEICGETCRQKECRDAYNADQYPQP